MKTFYIPQYREHWTLTGEGKFPSGKTYYNFTVEETGAEITHFDRDKFDDLFIEDVIK